jgi:S-DNA-T family DNA segregation ATPase FtsK/SpoIIIE
VIGNLPLQLTNILAHFNIFGSVGQATEGPLVISIDFLLNEGSKFSSVEKMIKDIAREMCVSGIRVSEIPNSKYIRFEIPQIQSKTVPFLPLVYSAEFIKALQPLPICLGVDMLGNPVMRDLAKMPHLLVSGTTGSGKSVGLNSFILSLIKKRTPEELQFILIDPKRIEFSMYNNQKYMMRPVITDMNMASICLTQLTEIMNERYALFEQNMVRNIGEYTAKGLKMPYIVCIIDEFADLIMFDKTVEKQVQLLAQKSRAAGIHLIIATQRPSVDVITGTIKANLPTRLAYKVASPADSMTILNTTGAETLLGHGDSLFLEENGTLTRILGAYVSTDDILNTLEEYRVEAPKENKTVNYIVTRQQEETLAQRTAEQAKEAEKRTGICARIADFWQRLGRRNQNKIINAVINGCMLLIGTKKNSAVSTLIKSAVKSSTTGKKTKK